MMATKKFHINFKPRKKTHPPKTLPALDEWIPRSEAIALIAEYCKPAHQSLRETKNKVAGRIKYAIDVKRLVEVDGGFIFNDLISWAKTKTAWNKKLQALRHRSVAHMNGLLPSIIGQAQTHVLPTSLDDCHRRIVELETQIATLEARIEEQRAYAEYGRQLKHSRKK